MGNHAMVTITAASNADNVGAAHVASPAGQSGQAAPVQLARVVVKTAQEARDRVAAGRATLPRAAALLELGGPTLACATPKNIMAGAAASGPAEMHNRVGA